MKSMTIEIWSDIVCPWCYIGKRRFESALARFTYQDQVEIIWRSFELDLHAPRRYAGTLDDLAAKKLSVSQAHAAALNARVTAMAAAEGLDYRLDQAKYGNTFDAHRLIHLAAIHGQQGAVKERLLHAYFTEGWPISEPDTLVTVGTEAGIPADAVRAMLTGDAYAEAVRADERRAAMFGIQGVPFFVIDEQYGVSGAPDPAVFLNALEQAWAKSPR